MVTDGLFAVDRGTERGTESDKTRREDKKVSRLMAVSIRKQ